MNAFPEIVRELWMLLRGYAKQELVTPLKTLWLYLAWGVGGALAVVLGSGLLLLGVLRLLQTEVIEGRASEGRSSLPYLAIFALCLVVMVILYRRIDRQFEQPA